MDVCIAAIRALGSVGASDIVPLVKPLLCITKNERTLYAGAKALGDYGTSKDAYFLSHLLCGYHSSDVRCAAAEALGKIGTSEHIPLLVPLFRDQNSNVIRAAVEALGKIVRTGGIILLGSLLRDKDYQVCDAASSALGMIGTWKDIPLLEPLLRDKKWSIRRHAAEVLGKIGTSEHIPLLAPLLRDESMYVYDAAFEVLGEIGTAEHIPLLEPLLWDKSTDVRSAAIKALGNIGTSENIPLLEPLLRDKEWSVRHEAAATLEKIVTAKDIPLLISLIRDKDYQFHDSAGTTLVKFVTTDHIPLLKSLLRDESILVRHTVAEGIEKIYKLSTPELRIDRVLPKKKAPSVKAYSAQTLHILHISDIHYALEKDSTITCIFNELIQDIKIWRTQQSNTNIHSICITGDIAQSGQENQYDSIDKKIKDILKTTDCPIENLFIIPGNHDVQEYDKISPQGKTLLEQVRDHQMNIDSDVLSNFENYSQFHDKFANYYRFIENSGYLNSLAQNFNHLPRPCYSRKLKDSPVRILGLNSALLCLKDFIQYGNIQMGIDQFLEAYSQGKPRAIRENELLILLTHHPVNWLVENEYEDYSTLLEQYTVIHLYGHIHKRKTHHLFSSSGSYVSIGTGSLYGEKGIEDINTYHIITFDFKNQELHIWPRRWNPDLGKWTVYDDDGNNLFPLPHLRKLKRKGKSQLKTER
jgi:HEAT repeat protein/predicted phosphodiesterase